MTLSFPISFWNATAVLFQNVLHDNGNKVSYQVVWLCEFFLVLKLSPVQCFILWCYEKTQNLNSNAFCKYVGHCIMRFVIPQGCFVKKGLWAVTLAEYLKTDSLQQLLSFYSVFLACQKCSTRALAVYVSHVCSVFLCFVSSFTTEQQKRLSSLAGMMWKVCYPPAAASAGAKLVLW